METYQLFDIQIEHIKSWTTATCKNNLTDEYAALCEKLIDKVISSNSADILMSGDSYSLAAGVLQVISVNNRLSKSRTHKVTTSMIAEWLKVSPATVYAKAKLIRQAAEVKPDYDQDYATAEALANDPILRHKVLFAPLIQSLRKRGALPKR